MTDEDVLPPGTPIDLDNCAREPIHLSGAVQPRGVLLVVTDPDLFVLQATTNTDDLLGVVATDCLGKALQDVIGKDAARAVSYAVSTFGDLRERNPIEQQVDVRGEKVLFDLILHRSDEGVLLVELEPAGGPRPLSFPNTYLAVRSSVAALNRAASLAELYQVTADSVRALTGFDRVMVYRYDHEYNGEVVAEAKRADLNSFLGLHYPATDIPAQARALYEKNWIRLISDIGYVPAPLVPAENPVIGGPVDLTYSTLRSVSPIHVEYLKNMGVEASMSISLLRDGKLWGLIACHHYTGPHTPPYGIRAAAEFLGSSLSIRLLDRYDDEAMRDRIAKQSLLARVVAASRDDTVPLADALAVGPDLRVLVPAPGLVIRTGGRVERIGLVPPDDVVDALVAWAAAQDPEIAATDRVDDIVDVPADLVSGALVLQLPDGDHIVWTRPETKTSVDWGGDPHNKAIAIREGDGVRLSPRRSFERWSEVVRRRSTPWTDIELELAHDLRRHLVESLYARSRYDVALAESVQRSLLPEMPDLGGWSITAHYQPAAGGRIGGDWYDAFELADDRLALVLGDVAGHGVPAAGAMAELRNVLRAYLHGGASPQRATELLNAYVLDMAPGLFATLLVATVDCASGTADVVCAGHPQPFVLSGGRATPLDVPVSPPLGVPGSDVVAGTARLGAGDCLVVFSDGLIERRGEDIDEGAGRVAALLEALPDACDADAIVAHAQHDGRDDVTVLTATRR